MVSSDVVASEILISVITGDPENIKQCVESIVGVCYIIGLRSCPYQVILKIA